MIKSIHLKKIADASQISFNEVSGYRYMPVESAIVNITYLKGVAQCARDYSCKFSKYTRGKFIGRDRCVINLVCPSKPDPHACQPD